MKIVGRREIWIHTHFVTDCAYLPDHLAREIRRKVERLLERLRIVFGIHFDARYDGGLRIVLECIPLPETMGKIESGLAEIVAPIPARPRQTKVRVEPPARRVSAARR
jgi:hypothetical protein